MGFLGDAVSWFTTAEHWRGTNGVPHRLWEHVALSAAAVLAAALVALPIGALLGHKGRGGFAAINISNVGRALPSLAILALAVEAIGYSGWPGFGARPAFIALVALAVPPMVTNTYTALREVDRDVKEAATGMGMTGRQVLRRVELPLAMPLILVGVRTAAVQVVATASLAAVTAWGGLGRYIVDGFSLDDHAQVLAGAVLVGLLSILTEAAFALLQRLLRRGSHSREERSRMARRRVATVGAR